MSAQKIQLALSGVQKRFGNRLVLENAALELTGGECKLLCGENGAGKTTLLRIAAGLEKPDKGNINTGLGDVSWRRCRKTLQEKIVYLHQQPYLFDGSVMHNLKFALSGKKMNKKESAHRALQWAGLEELEHHAARTLSGGEKQRVALARAWLRNPAVMLLDEPTANMDAPARLRALELLQQLKQEGLALLIATHDPVQFRNLVDSCLTLKNGKIFKEKDVHYTDGSVVSIHQFIQ
ncbi:MAG TPA: energy-coupling factor ABC transporter ATP-binding protein [Chromatiales bacterium]|nr:energy-coupling factor ABC transporter ATP-binding protein [Thiotrichales bacterium]HIP68843.1 energy-coupling factor ABC transporter ATP-binding protein [Chromatiales bacterium]